MKETPKWYLISSIVLAGLIFLDVLELAVIPSFFEPIYFTWFLLSIIMSIYFIAKKYKKSSLILPILFLISAIVIIYNIGTGYEHNSFTRIAFLLIVLSIIGVSLYLFWKE